MDKIARIKRKIMPILKRYGVIKAALFGSVVRGDERKDSDIDILVDIEKDIGLLEFIGLKQDLEDALGHPVDLVEYGTIKPLLRDRILSEQVVLL
jgi:predicted nucleotidyltransferase